MVFHFGTLFDSNRTILLEHMSLLKNVSFSKSSKLFCQKFKLCWVRTKNNVVLKNNKKERPKKMTVLKYSCLLRNSCVSSVLRLVYENSGKVTKFNFALK